MKSVAHANSPRAALLAVAVATHALFDAALPARAADSVRYQKNDGDKAELIMTGIEKAIDLWNKKVASEHPRVVFDKNGPGGVAIVPLSKEKGGRSSLNFSKDAFNVERTKQVWAQFDFININDADKKAISFDVKADKSPSFNTTGQDRYRNPNTDNDKHPPIRDGTKIWLATPTSEDRAYYFLFHEGSKDQVLSRNPSAAIKITILNKRGQCHPDDDKD